MNASDRVQASTSTDTNREIREDARHTVLAHAHKSRQEISTRLHALETEWDVERLLETNASVLALMGVVLGLSVNRRFFAIPCVVLPFLLQHALQGWCPPLPILRRLGVRTRAEIDREKFALKALRGDFVPAGTAADGDARALAAWQGSAQDGEL